MDEASFERLSEDAPPIYAKMAETVRILHDEGFIELADYTSSLQENNDLLQKMTEHDASHGPWDAVLAASEAIWSSYIIRALPLLEESMLATRGEMLHFSVHGDFEHAERVALDGRPNAASLLPKRRRRAVYAQLLLGKGGSSS